MIIIGNNIICIYFTVADSKIVTSIVSRQLGTFFDIFITVAVESL